MTSERVVANFTLDELNSLTKYPSIPTYHRMGERGKLEEPALALDREKLLITEKIDGANARVVFFPTIGDWFIGSREEFLTAKDDRIHSKTLGIVDAVRPLVDKFPRIKSPIVVYGEVYGRKIGSGGKNYTTTDKVGFRVFDIMDLNHAIDTCNGATIEEIASWRDNMNQKFLPWSDVQEWVESAGIEMVPRIPAIDHLPLGIDDTYVWLCNWARTTRASLDYIGAAEGVVVRSWDNRERCKIRFEDYERTIRRKS